MSKDFIYWLRIENLKPINFYPYKSGVICRILTQNHNYETEEHNFLNGLGSKIQDVVGKQILWDNKVVIECEIISSRIDLKALSKIYIGKYDGIWSVGLGVWSDPWITPIPIK